MQVLNGGDFEQKNVLVGGGETEAYGVTNDPVLMNMLSTGLYQHPMRTMIQETMFNAWDAHRMGNCQDRPIDIYINDTSGLMIRDYGPGIHTKDIHPIYCIYGHSTKRQNDDLTGGFGLGSKSPYAYTDSFTVVSHHDGFKGMYVMNRVSEKSQGGPGRSVIFEGIPTEETGLLVTIPLKNDSDMLRAYEYVKELLYLSGIKANIYYEDRDLELIEAQSLAPGEWVVNNEDFHGSDIYAVYGGVRYKIVEDDSYYQEFQFVKKMSKLLGNILIGFKPSTLSPLPSREGLNLNEKTVETIKTQLEILEENFRMMLTPVTRVVLKESFKVFKDSGIEPKFLIEKWRRIGDHSLFKMFENTQQLEIINNAIQQCPPEFNQSMWNSLCTITFRHTESIERLIGSQKLTEMLYIIWAKNLPEHKAYKPYIISPQRSYIAPENRIIKLESPKSSRDLIDAKKICDDASNQKTEMRVEKRDSWYVVENTRRAGKVNYTSSRQKRVIDALGGTKALTMPSREYPDRLWYKRDGEEYIAVNLTKTVILAKTLVSLKNTRFNYQKMFAPKYPNEDYHSSPYYRSTFSYYHYRQSETLVGAIIVHQKNGGYDKALQALKDAGYTVYEADEPKPITKKPLNYKPQSRTKPTYPLYTPANNDWADWDNMVEDPTCYLNITENTLIKGYRKDKPDTTLMAWVAQNTPRFVIVHNKARLTKKFDNIPSYQEKLDSLINKLLQDKNQIETMLLHSILAQESSIPQELLELPEVLKFFGLPYVRTKQKEQFRQNYNLLIRAKDCRFTSTKTRRSISYALDGYYNKDSLLLVRQRIGKLSLFDRYQLSNFIRNMKPGELKVFSEKLIRFLRTT